MLPDAVAHVKDLHNGHYMLELVQPLLPAENASMESTISSGGTFNNVILQYACGLGSYMPPTKYGGAINSRWYAQVPEGFLPPIAMSRDRPKPQSFGKQMGSYRAIYAIGDSLMRQFIGGYYRRKNFASTHISGEFGHAAALGMPLKSSTLHYFVGLAENFVKHQGIEGDKGSDCALWLGSGVWDVLANNEEEQSSFHDHLKALREYISFVQGLTKAQIYWKFMTGLHNHRTNGANLPGGPRVERVRYLSASRGKMLFDAQMELMKELNIPVFDMYNFSYEAADQGTLMEN